jgi:hypothetical protein
MKRYFNLALPSELDSSCVGLRARALHESISSIPHPSHAPSLKKV